MDEWLPAPIASAPVTFLLVARLLREKGIVEYAEAARHVKALYPDVRFVSSIGEPADRIVEVPVEVASTEPFDPHEVGTVELLRIVRTRLWEDNRIEQAERVTLIALANDVMARLGSMASK